MQTIGQQSGSLAAHCKVDVVSQASVASQVGPALPILILCYVTFLYLFFSSLFGEPDQTYVILHVGCAAFRHGLWLVHRITDVPPLRNTLD